MKAEQESHIGTVGWGLIAGFVLAWDLAAPETLSSAVDRALETDTGRLLAVGAVAVTGAHLLNMLPERHDPFVLAFRALESARDMLGHE